MLENSELYAETTCSTHVLASPIQVHDESSRFLPLSVGVFVILKSVAGVPTSVELITTSGPVVKRVSDPST